MSKLICGCGYLGIRVAQRWLASGNTVWATTRSDERARELSAAGLRPIVADVTRQLVLPAAATSVDTVLFALGFDRSPHQNLHDVYLGGLTNTMAALPDSVERFIYISTTGVYGAGAGASSGEWVDENSPCHPTRPGGAASLAAEQMLAKSRFAERHVVLRLAGIYGPGRIPKLAAVKRGEPLDVLETGYLNLIYVDDAADIVETLERFAPPPQTFVVSDGQPVLRGDFYRELARLLHAPLPTFLASSNSPEERGSSDKRVSNQRLREILDKPLRFPSYREGLAAIVKTMAG